MVNILTALVAACVAATSVSAAAAPRVAPVKFRLQTSNPGGKYDGMWVTPEAATTANLNLTVVPATAKVPKSFYFTSDLRLEFAVSSTVSKGLVFQSVPSGVYAVPATLTPKLGTLRMVDDELLGLVWDNFAKFDGWLVCSVVGKLKLWWMYAPNSAAKIPKGCVAVRLVEVYA